MDQTSALLTRRVQVPVYAVGGDHFRGDQIRQVLALVTSTLTGVVIKDCCRHFIPRKSNPAK